MKLAIMTKPTFFVEEDKILATLFDKGMDNLHLFKPGSSPLYAERLLSLVSDDFYPKITVHEHYYLKNEYKLAGIHLQSYNEEAPNGYRGKISCNCDNLNILKDIRKKFDYIFLWNSFDSNEFPSQKSNFTLQELEAASRDGIINKRVYAMGGMTLEKIKIAKELGFGGVVVCGDLWNHFDIHNEADYRNLITHFEKLRKAAD